LCIILRKCRQLLGALLQTPIPQTLPRFCPWTPLGDFRPSDPLICCPPLEKILRVLMNMSLALLLFSFHVVDLLLFRLLKIRFCTLFLKRFSRLVVHIKPREMGKKCDVRRSSGCTYVLYMQVIVSSAQRTFSGSTDTTSARAVLCCCCCLLVFSFDRVYDCLTSVCVITHNTKH